MHFMVSTPLDVPILAIAQDVAPRHQHIEFAVGVNDRLKNILALFWCDDKQAVMKWTRPVPSGSDQP